ncbi:MAG TPA: universal stress protein [Flavobacteriaceae bacterium]|nr:universal stress protein [Flavobacteriaceae bacterium]
MKTILVPLSSHETGESVLQYAFDFAAEFSAEIVILKSFGIPTVTGSTPQIDAILTADIAEELNEILAKIQLHNVAYSLEFVKGRLVENCEEYLLENDVDLIISKPKKSKRDKDLFIGHLSGKMIKKLDCPMLLVPTNTVFKPFKTGLLAIRSGIIKKKNVLLPLVEIKNVFKTYIYLVQVKTPKIKEEDLIINANFLTVKNSLHITENETIFKGAQTYFEELKPDFLCVIKRKYGFFSKLWDTNTVKKTDFKSEIPVLVLKGSL